jgi:hypothetical protein
MSKRINIQGQQFGELLALEFSKSKNTHATWKCLCMICNEITYISYGNLASGNTTKCASCGQKAISNGVVQDIEFALSRGDKITAISKHYKISRATVYRVKREMLCRKEN